MLSIDLVVPIYVPFLVTFFSLVVFLQNIEYHSLCYTAGPCRQSVLCVVAEHPISDVPQKEGTSLSPSERRSILTLAATWRSWCYYIHVTDVLTGSH